MISEVFLSNENYIRSITNIDNNVQSKFILSALREAQEVNLQQILGSNLLRHLKTLIVSGDIKKDSNIMYKTLLDECQLYLSYQTVVNLCLITSVKISNGGLQQTSDEHLNVLGVGDTFTIQEQYQKKSDFFARRLQEFILNNIKDFPEIQECECISMKSNLKSSASTNLWLGGKRSPARTYKRRLI